MFNLKPQTEQARPFDWRIAQAAQLGSIAFADLASGGSGYALDDQIAFEQWRL